MEITSTNIADLTSFDTTQATSQANFAKMSEQLSEAENLSTSEDKTKLAKAARGFEAIFVNMLLKEMKLGQMENSEDDSGFGSDTLMGYMNMQLAEQISNTGSGIGLAEQIYSQLTGGEKLPGNSQVSINREMPLREQLMRISAGENQSVQSESEAKVTNVSTESKQTVQQVKGNFIDRVKARLSQYDDIITKASNKYNVDESLIKGIITAESAGKPTAKSAVGAKGLMQLMDATAKELGVTNPYDPEQNIMAGTKYIKQQLDTFGGTDHALAAYNAGAGNVRKYNGIPPFRETQNYVEKVKQYAKIFRT